MKKKYLFLIILIPILFFIFFSINKQELINSNNIESININSDGIVIHTKLPKYRSIDGSAVSINVNNPDVMDIRIFTKIDLSMKNNKSVTVVPTVTDLKKVNIVNRYGNIIYSWIPTIIE